MMRKILILALVLVMSCEAMASDVEVWQDPSVNFSALKKIFVMPPKFTLNAGTQLMPQKQLRADFFTWTVDGIHSAFGKKKSSIMVKNLDSVVSDMKFIHGDNASTSSPEFFKWADEMGYTAFITAEVKQEFVTEHVPETTRTYTEYREIEKRDAKGRVIETIRIPEEKTEVIPAHDVTYLHTVCEPRIYSTKDADGDYIGAVKYTIYREYQGGPVMKVVENITKASMKTLFAGRK
ncbi:MAG: hypothetical protein IJG51_11630 [Synergistaceae bacterium]|nr:hypothetical protein [Synergistaceae bacterium]MBQ3347161.1 hypothetical protein [Synergistaceae bacterium]MBQ3399530.1 hypothetical protein [Synergistaceae bacterium]MBQ4402279.1 hypothetical protein [Synergistaceae bacterium]MBQ6114485.1 hypothetical protein [Synergistaceae bacterium]